MVQAIEQILFRAFNRTLFFNDSFGIPLLEAADSMLAAVGCKDQSIFWKAAAAIHFSDFNRRIAHFMGDATLSLDKGINRFNGLQKRSVAIDNNELELFANSPRPLRYA